MENKLNSREQENYEVWRRKSIFCWELGKKQRTRGQRTCWWFGCFGNWSEKGMERSFPDRTFEFLRYVVHSVKNTYIVPNFGFHVFVEDLGHALAFCLTSVGSKASKIVSLRARRLFAGEPIFSPSTFSSKSMGFEFTADFSRLFYLPTKMDAFAAILEHHVILADYCFLKRWGRLLRWNRRW